MHLQGPYGTQRSEESETKELITHQWIKTEEDKEYLHALSGGAMRQLLSTMA